MRRLIPYGLGVGAAAGAEYLLAYVLYVYVLCGSLACVPYGYLAHRHVTGWDVLFGNYFMGMSGAVGGLLGIVVADRLEPRHRWGLSLAQGIIAMLAPLAVRNLISYLLLVDIAVWASAGAISAFFRSLSTSQAVRSCVGR